MKNTKKIGFLIFLILFILQSKAQNAITAELPNINQLPTKEILYIYQDSEGYMWYGTEGGLCRDDGYQISVFRSDFNTPKLLESNSVTSIVEDKDGKIWFGTKRGIYILDKKNYQISPLSDKEIKNWVIKTITSTSDGSIWITSGNSLFRFNTKGERLGNYEIKWGNTVREVSTICEDNEGAIWMVQSKGGLFWYNPQKDQFIQYPWPYEEPASCIVKDASSPYYWIGTWGNGIVRFNPEEKEIHRMFVQQSVTTKHTDIEKKRISKIIQDSIKHNLWITTPVNLFAYEITDNDTLRKIDTSHFLSEDKKMLRHIMCDRLGNIWVTGNYPDSYSFIVSYLPNKIISYPMDVVKKELDVYASPTELSYEKDYYWIRQRRLGLYVYEPMNKKLTINENWRRDISFFFEKATDRDGIYAAVYDSEIILIQYDGKHFSETKVCKIPLAAHARIRNIHDDGHGNLWIGTTFNLFKHNLKQGISEKIYDETGIINDIVSINDETVYIATESEGFWEITNGKRTFKHFTKENYFALAIAPDHKIWSGTLQGSVYCYDPATKSITTKTEECGMIGDAIYDILTDNNGNVWILTDQKITIYNPENQIVNLIDYSDHSIFLDNFLSLYKGENGEIHVGGRGGVIVFPDINQFEKTPKEPLIWLTSVKINNAQKVLEEDSRNITLKPEERNIELFFSTFDHLNTTKIRYAFRKKKDDTWNYLPVGQNSIYLAGLSKGDYELEVRATDGNGIWTKGTTTILVHRLPAWFQTWWAFVLYILVFVSIVGFVIQKYIQSQKEKQQKDIDEQVSQMKYRFFTNISHELRTPLTLIITPLETITQRISDDKIKQQLEYVKKNAQNLLSLVNQLLDFRKIEMGGETLSLAKGDVNELLASTYESFKLIAEDKNIDFVYKNDMVSYYMFFDAGKLRKVINNLLSNAFKFTDKGGSVQLAIHEENKDEESYVVISVKDTGKGIPNNEISTVFERFHQVQGQENTIGSGIGLHIVKEYVQLHNGNVFIESELGKGTTFFIQIPTNLKPEKAIVTQTTEQAQEEEALHVLPLKADFEKKILIVEDNTDFRTYLKNELSQFFKVFEAADGLEGEKEATANEPDIIITDLMMPGINGIELCHRIKNNIKTSHIPVILLTANDNIENQKKGYKEGADAYLSKPFHWEILMSRINHLMLQKTQRQQIFEKEIDVDPKEITISALDEKLIKKALELIDANLSNSEYSIDDLSSDLCMSRSNLYRKINSITGITPTDFVRNVRLKKAAELLKIGEFNVVEVAYSVGFNTPSYFTKSFKNLFGVLPTQYNKR